MKRKSNLESKAVMKAANPMIPRKFEPALFGLFLSGMMSFLVSGIATMRTAGFVPHFMTLWMDAWLTAWPVAFPAVLLVAPIARRLVQRLVGAKQPG